MHNNGVSTLCHINSKIGNSPNADCNCSICDYAHCMKMRTNYDLLILKEKISVVEVYNKEELRVRYGVKHQEKNQTFK